METMQEIKLIEEVLVVFAIFLGIPWCLGHVKRKILLLYAQLKPNTWQHQVVALSFCG